MTNRSAQRTLPAVELEESNTEFAPVADGRPKLVPPPPVTLVAIADVALNAAAGMEKSLDAFYVGLLRMEREEAAGEGRIVYRTANVRLCLAVHECPPPREDFRPLEMMVPSLAEMIDRLNEAKVDFVRQRSLWAGSDWLILTDPAGNLVHVAATGTAI